MATAEEIFGPNSDGGVRMSEWFDVMCVGCKNGRYEEGIGYGVGCEVGARAAIEPYTADMPEWSLDAMWPERFREAFADGDPWPVCMAYEPRKRRWDAGLRRGPRLPDNQPDLFGELT
jgi:hypothetical protein